MTSKETKKAFFNFFNSKKHHFIPSAPIVLKNDPTLMFSNAGMNQFKSIFLGNENPNEHRVYNTQKCLRVSGKHNDLEEVGIDHYHHTMFEMMGNWSFGDYFKKEAITWAWELLTAVYKIDKNNLYVTVFEGDKGDNLQKDNEAYTIWKSIVSEDHIVLGNKKDNFWEMGEQGPCGPSSEIHIDLRSDDEKQKIPAQEVVNKDHPDVIEIWNLVFIEFNRKANGTLEKLPQKHVDTGMGFERLCRILQNKNSNYDTDIFLPIINTIEKVSGYTYGKDNTRDIAFRVIADHIRAVTFCIIDGQLPSSNGAGYVIRRILRRAVRYAYTFLNLNEAFLYKLVEVLDSQFKEDYPEISTQKALCQKVIKEEERSFLKTLSQGLHRLEDIINESKTKQISGYKAFELYDTYGFPIDLTALILSEKNYTYNTAEFEEALKKQKNRSKKDSESTTDDWVILNHNKETEFIGYDNLISTSKLLKYRKIKSSKDGISYHLVLDKTPFYPEGGGQVGDKGSLIAHGNEVKIIDTKKEHGDIIHITKSLPENLNDNFITQVEANKRFLTTCNHTATHLLHHVLRHHLGSHVEQKGSLVNEKYLRFDFSHFEKISNESLKQIENGVNRMIAEKLTLQENRSASFEEAKANGAMALFGEKYGEKVRTIQFGNSIELCGGTHVNNTYDIWYFKILAESSVASGVRRIEAITNTEAKIYLENKLDELEEISQILNAPQKPQVLVENLIKEVEALKAENSHLLKDKTKNIKANLLENIQVIKGVNAIVHEVDLNPAQMKDIAFQLGGEIDNLFILLASSQDNKALLTCYISKHLVEEKSLHAGKIIKELGKHIQGGGGGQAFFATAGGKNPKGIQKALLQVINYI